MPRTIGVVTICLSLLMPACFIFAEPTEKNKPIALSKGQYLLLDDRLIARSDGVERQLIQSDESDERKHDRRVARHAGARGGLLVTPWVTLDADRLMLNVDARQGQVRVQVVDELDWPVYGLTFADCKPIKSDSLAAPVEWDQPLKMVRGKRVRLQFSIRNASLFAFELSGPESRDLGRD